MSPPRCPTCSDPVPPGAPFPFCSERCKLVDLGRWLGEAYRIPVEEPEETEPTGEPEKPQ